MKVLGLESSCDETGIAIFDTESGEMAQRLYSQIERHREFGGVVVQHLSPDFDSIMDELLARRTDIPIRHARDGVDLVADVIYLIPPKSEAVVSGGKLLLTDKDPKEPLTLPIDRFFRSLAQDYGTRAIGVILSGSGSDGSRGVREIHEAGGFVICESEETAGFNGMPLSAQETGAVDRVLHVENIATVIAQREDPDSIISLENAQSSNCDLPTSGIESIFRQLNREYGIDFSHYKASTVGRRIERRLQMRGFTELEDYARYLESNPDELNSLYHDLLIGVTRFFRDPEAFETMEKTVIPDIIRKVPAEEEIRIWVAGCATGEEAYSIAILFAEKLEEAGRDVNLRILATDVHNASLEIAGTAIYSEESMQHVSPQRLERFFDHTGEGYRVSPELRQMIVFAPHNVLKDAPFTKLHFIACRNLLIYFRPLAQKKALALFHFGLKTGGLLLLGPSESPGELSDEFETIDARWKVFRKRRDVRLQAQLRLPPAQGGSAKLREVRSSVLARTPRHAAPDPGLIEAYDWILDHQLPAGFLIDDAHRLMHSFGGMEKFLRVPSGRPSNDALDLLDQRLRTAVTGAVQRAKKEESPVRYRGLSIPQGDGMSELYELAVEPFRGKRSDRDFFLITLQKRNGATSEIPDTTAEQANAEQLSSDRIDSLEEDLRFTKENLQATIEELETANEELQATNEELVASNEELQSTNEELHSVNEELYTVNAEYQKKIIELTELTADLDSLMESTEVATIFLDSELCVRKFTPSISQIFDLLPSDVGRRIDAFASKIQSPTLIEDIKAVLREGEPFQAEVQDGGGHWLFLRVLPYRPQKQIEGVVMTLINIESLKQAELSLSRTVKQREDFLAMLSHEMRNPVAALLNAAHLIQSEKAESDDRNEAVDVVSRQAKHLSRLLDDLLDISRMSSDKLEIRKSHIDLKDVLQTAVESGEPTLERRGHSLVVESCEEPVIINGDPDRLRQVIVNLLDNAAKYSNRDDQISLKLWKDDGHALLTVRDHGIGIAPEMVSRIFDPFVQSQNAADSSGGGMGVGLALVRHIVRQHGGTIEARSDGRGEGSTFFVQIPLIEPSQLQTKKSSSPPTTRHVESARVVLVEDQDDNRRMMQQMLELYGFQVRSAADGQSGAQLIVDECPDLAIVDIGLPGMSGYDVATEVRKRVGHSLMLIALSGYGQSSDIDAAKAAGFDAHLTKPIDFDRFWELIEQRMRPLHGAREERSTAPAK